MQYFTDVAVQKLIFNYDKLKFLIYTNMTQCNFDTSRMKGTKGINKEIMLFFSEGVFKLTNILFYDPVTSQ